MPQISTNAGGGRIVWNSNDFISGLAPNFSTDLTDEQRGNKQLVAMRAMNPFLSYGDAYPGILANDVTNVTAVTNPCLKGIVDGQAAYCVTSGARLQKLDSLISDGGLTIGFHTIAAHGGHSSVVGNDCVRYSAKVGGTSESRYFYSWSDSADWDIGTFDFVSTFDDDFMTTAPATPLGGSYLTDGVGYPHPMIVGQDDILYIGDRNFVHAYDGQNSADADGKFIAAVLTLPKGYVITSFAKTQYGLMVFSYLENSDRINSYFYQGRATAWLWDELSLDPTASYELNDNYCTEAFNYKGTVGVFTQGYVADPFSTKISKIQVFNGSRFEIMAVFSGDLPCRGGVEVVGESLQFNSNGIVYCYGSPLFGVTSGLNKIAEGLGTTSGMLGSFNALRQFISSGSSTTGGLQVFSFGYTPTANFATPMIEPQFPSSQQARVRCVKVQYTAAVTDGRGLTIQLKPRGKSAVTITSSVSTVTDLNKTFYLDYNGDALPAFDAIKLIAQWDSGMGSDDAPGIASVTVDYEYVNVP